MAPVRYRRGQVVGMVVYGVAVAYAEPAADPEPSPREAPGEVIVVTGLRLPRAVKDVPAAMQVIERRDIERSPHVLTDDLVRSLPSVGTFRRSSSSIADPTSQGLNLRGVGPSAVSRALVLRDGVPVSDPFGGWMYWRSISPLGIDRIEVAPSGASALFGDFALGGVLHIVSRPIESRTLQAVLAGGSLGTRRGAVRATDRIGDFGVAVDGEAFHTDGYAPIVPAQRGPIDGKAESDHGSAGIRIDHVLGGSTAHVTARWFGEDLDAGTEHTTAAVRAVTYAGGWQLVRDAGTLQLLLFGGDQEFRQERARIGPDRGSAEPASRQRTPSDNQGLAATWSTRAGTRHAIVLGADARRVDGTATDVLSPPMTEPESLVERSAGGQQLFLGAFAQDAFRLTPAVELAAALRVDAWTNRDGERVLAFAGGSRETTPFANRSELQINPRLGVLVHASDVVSLRGSAYRSFRAPTLNELYRPFQVGTVLTAANEALRPETLWGAEAGPQIVLDGIVVRATAFLNRLDDAIANVTLPMPLPGGATRQRQNLGAARVTGLELDASWRPARAWTFALAHTFMDAKVTEAPARPELVGKRLPQGPRMRTIGSIVVDRPTIATAAIQVRYLGGQFEDDLQELPIGAVLLVDARVRRALGRGISVFASVQNLFDRRYLVGRAGVDTEGTPRTFEVGLAFDSKKP